MRGFIREIFAGVYAPFTGRILASVALIPVLFSFSTGINTSAPLSNIVDESAIYSTAQNDATTVDISEIKEPDAGNGDNVVSNIVQSNQNNQTTPIDIAPSTPIKYDLAISGKIATSVEDVGIIPETGAVRVPNNHAGYYSEGGAHLLVGHNPGVFSGLTSVSIGEIIEFRGESYRVYDRKVYEYDPSIKVYDVNKNLTKNGVFMYESLYAGGGSSLNLMTCYGSYLPQFDTYNQRLVVFANKI